MGILPKYYLDMNAFDVDGGKIQANGDACLRREDNIIRFTKQHQPPTDFGKSSTVCIHAVKVLRN